MTNQLTMKLRHHSRQNQIKLKTTNLTEKLTKFVKEKCYNKRNSTINLLVTFTHE